MWLEPTRPASMIALPDCRSGGWRVRQSLVRAKARFGPHRGARRSRSHGQGHQAFWHTAIDCRQMASSASLFAARASGERRFERERHATQLNCVHPHGSPRPASQSSSTAPDARALAALGSRMWLSRSPGFCPRKERSVHDARTRDCARRREQEARNRHWRSNTAPVTLRSPVPPSLPLGGQL
jgi:hypothetical protein